MDGVTLFMVLVVALGLTSLGVIIYAAVLERRERYNNNEEGKHEQ